MASEPINTQFPVPWGRFTQLEALSGNPYTAGLHLVDRIRGPINCDAFGFAWQAASIAPGIGQVSKTVTRYDRVVAELMEVKLDFLAATYNGPIHLVEQDEGRFLFSEFPIERMSCWVSPGVSMNFYWILAL